MIILLIVGSFLAQPRPGDLVASPEVVDLALNCVCYSRPDKEACRSERRAEVVWVASDLLWITAQRPEVPESMRLVLLAVACGESGMRSRPTCGGNPRCNDSNTSGGMFQIKLTERKNSLRWVYLKAYGESLDVFDHAEAARFYLDRLIKGVLGKVKQVCGYSKRTTNQIWSIAAIRLGRGPILYWQPSICREISGSQVCTKRKAVQRCSPTSKYARLAVDWYSRCRDCWKLINNEHSGFK